MKPVTEEEVDAAEKLRAKGEYRTALTMTQQMLLRVEDGDMYERLLFDVLYCSTRLGLNEVTDQAIAELERLPQPDMSRIIVDFIQAMTYIAQGKAQEGLDLIENNLQKEAMDRDDFRFWKYRHLAYKGSALVWLARCDEALITLASAHSMDPNGQRETAILIDQANCLLALNRYEEAYNAASHALERGDDEDLATRAMEYMADCRMWQERWLEALALYEELKKRLPSRLVQRDPVIACIKRAKAKLKRERHKKWPA